MTSQEKINQYIELKTKLENLIKIMTIEELGEANEIIIAEKVERKKYIL